MVESKDYSTSIRDIRKELLTKNKDEPKVITVIHKGDKRVLADKFCSVCMRQLTKWDPVTKETSALFDYYNIKVGKFEIQLCHNIANCKNQLNKEGNN